MNKKWIGTTILALSIIAGCGGKNDDAPATETSTIQISVEKTTPPAEQPETTERSKQVHGGNTMPPAARGTGPLPAGHPPLPGAQAQRPPSARPGLPSGHAPFANGRSAGGPMMNAQPVANDGASVPLATGAHSPSADMQAGKKTITDAALQKKFEDAFRKTFTQNRGMRDYNGAEALLKDVLAVHPDHPQSLRTMGYVAVNQGFNVEKAMKYYMMSVKADEAYGPGHYALAFMYARGDREQGGKHYLRALELGVPDARSIGQSFYPHLLQPPKQPPVQNKE